MVYKTIGEAVRTSPSTGLEITVRGVRTCHFGGTNPACGSANLIFRRLALFVFISLDFVLNLSDTESLPKESETNTARQKSGAPPIANRRHSRLPVGATGLRGCDAQIIESINRDQEPEDRTGFSRRG